MVWIFCWGGGGGQLRTRIFLLSEFEAPRYLALLGYCWATPHLPSLYIYCRYFTYGQLPCPSFDTFREGLISSMNDSFVANYLDICTWWKLFDFSIWDCAVQKMPISSLLVAFAMFMIIIISHVLASMSRHAV